MKGFAIMSFYFAKKGKYARVKFQFYVVAV